MTFQLSYLAGKTIAIDDVTAIVENVDGDMLKLKNLSGYHNIFHHIGSYIETKEWYQLDTITNYIYECEPFITIPSAYSNVYISFSFTTTLYKNTLPFEQYIFSSNQERNIYFENHPDELTNGKWIKIGQDFYTYNLDTTAWISTPVEYTIHTSTCNISTNLNTLIDIGTGNNPLTCTYDGITKNSDEFGDVYLCINISTEFDANNWYKLEISISDLVYKNYRDEKLLNGEGCLPPSYISKRISVIN